MATEYKLSYTASEINKKLGMVDELNTNLEDLFEEKVDYNQGTANVGKILVVGADGNLTLADMPSGGSDDAIGYVDENNNIILSGLADGTYVIKYENTDGTYADITTYVVGGVVQYSITPTLTNCTSVSGNVTIINEGGAVTLQYVASDGFALTDTVTVSGASYTWDSSTGTLVLSNPTSDVTVTITATKSGYTNIVDTVGYTDGYRLSTSTGNLSEATGYTSTGLITVMSGTHVIRTKGVNFNYGSSCAIVLYLSDETYSTANKLYNQGATSWNGLTWSFDADGNLTMNYSGNYYVNMKICGYGSGADLII